MPICVGSELQRMDDGKFTQCAYQVMQHAFTLREEFGPLFQESIYQQELAFRVPEARCEVPIELEFDGFSKTFYLDLLVGGGAVFELKAVQSLTEQHRRQLLQYLFLTDLPHGKLVNFRSERVQHAFVNNTLSRSDRVSFGVDDTGWQDLETTRLKERMIAVLQDWGTGLEVGLYGEVAAWLCGQTPDTETKIEIRQNGRLLGSQPVRLASPSVALRTSALPPERLADYEMHLRRFLEHTCLHSIQWVNITRQLVQFKTIKNT